MKAFRTIATATMVGIPVAFLMGAGGLAPEVFYTVVIGGAVWVYKRLT